MVQTFKNSLKICTNDAITSKLNRFLSQYWTNPHPTTGVTAAELMFGQTIKTKFDLLCPDLNTRVNSAQEKQKEYFDKRTKNRVFNDNDLVYVRNYSRTSNVRWIPGRINKRIGNMLYEVILQNNLTQRHVNQLKIRVEERIPELEGSSYTTVRNRTEFSKNLTTSSDTSRYPVWSQSAPIRFADEDWN